jgi:hypothetical protein
MKTFTVIITVLSFAGTVSSCKKNYTCTCTKTYSGSSAYNVNSTYTYKDNKKEADDKCKKNETSGSDNYGAYNVSCSTATSY